MILQNYMHSEFQKHIKLKHNNNVKMEKLILFIFLDNQHFNSFVQHLEGDSKYY